MALIAIQRKKKASAEQTPTPQNESVKADEVQITSGAARRVAEKLASEGQPQGIMRIGIKGGGCSGLTYHFAVEAEPKATDRVFSAHDVRVCVDPKSLTLLGGTILDVEEGLGKSGFVMRNPNASGSCSCGASFAL
jgi:iron-sulfur cluster assembly accessory protein